VPDPATDLGAYAEALLSLAERPGVRTILPFREADVYVLARNEQAFDEHVATVWPGIETVQAVQDRVQLFDAARRAGVSTPATAPLDQWEAWDRELIVKPRFTVHATEYADRFTESESQSSSTRFLAPDAAIDPEELRAVMGHDPLVQEYVPSSAEYGFFALYDRGEAVVTFQHRQLRGWKYSGGPSAYRESVAIPELDRAGRALLDELEWHGVAMVEFLRDPATDQFELMEVNPRFWSSLPFSIQAGVDFPCRCWKLATGRSIDTSPEYDVGVAGHLLWGELLHVHSVLREEYPLVERPPALGTLGAVMSSLVTSPRFDYVSLDDPGPFLRQVWNNAAAVTSLALGRDTADREYDTPRSARYLGSDSQDGPANTGPDQVLADGR
jgi:predicted ATP-grasp superfamily ATP-dependent carboligase